MRSQEREHEKVRIEQSFPEMNKEIMELSSMVKAATEKMTNIKEENDQNVRNIGTSLRSDMLTGVSANPMPTPNTQLPRRSPQSFHEPQMDNVMTEIDILRTPMTDGVIQPKILQTQVPLFRRRREKYKEFEHLRKNNIRPHVHKLTEEKNSITSRAYSEMTPLSSGKP